VPIRESEGRAKPLEVNSRTQKQRCGREVTPIPITSVKGIVQGMRQKWW
jgi:hypothetical protein